MPECKDTSQESSLLVLHLSCVLLDKSESFVSKSCRLLLSLCHRRNTRRRIRPCRRWRRTVTDICIERQGIPTAINRPIHCRIVANSSRITVCHPSRSYTTSYVRTHRWPRHGSPKRRSSRLIERCW